MCNKNIYILPELSNYLVTQIKIWTKNWQKYLLIARVATFPVGIRNAGPESQIIDRMI